jgi:hypothetical protein
MIAQGTRAQRLDEAIAGVEYEVMPGLIVDGSYRRRSLGSVIEDVWAGDRHIIGNPGRFDDDAAAELAAEIASLPAGSPERERLEARLDGLEALGALDEPRRDHDEVRLGVAWHDSRELFARAAYTWRRTRGNYPGLLDDDRFDARAHVTSQFDLVDLMPNRDGPLPQDRTHAFELDAYRAFELGGAHALTLGTRLRAASGTPVDVLGRHPTYGWGEAYLLPRGAAGRTELAAGADLHLGYQRDLPGQSSLTLFADLFNLLNWQAAVRVDEAYTDDAARPIVGGEEEDLVYLKRATASGAELRDPVSRNRNFEQPTARQTPLTIRFGVRVSF